MSENEKSADEGGTFVIDNFCPHADLVRASALASGFGTWKPSKGEVGSSNYDGMNFWGDHGLMIKSLTEHLGYAIAPNSMFFRVTNKDTEAAYIHSDREAGKFTIIVYLSRHPGEQTGTAFFKHRETGATRMRSFSAMSQDPAAFEIFKDQMVKGSLDDWELTRFIAGEFNRALIFEAPLFHARYPRHGFADSAEEGRMVWVCHFDFLQGIHHG